MSAYLFPDQTIPESKKTKEWHIEHGTGYVLGTTSDDYTNQKLEMLKYYRAYNAEMSEKQIDNTKSITCPHGIDLGVEYVVYPLIQSKIEQIVGEYMSRPLRRKAYVLDKASKNKKFEKKLAMLSEEMMREIKSDLQKEMGFDPETENGDVQLPPDVEKFFESDFKMMAEQVTDNLMSFLLDVRKEKVKLRELFLDYAIVDRAHAFIDKKDSHTTIRKVHPLDADYDVDPKKIVQDDHDYFFEHYWMSENEIYNSFSLSYDEKKNVKTMFATYFQNGSLDTGDLQVQKTAEGWVQTTNNTNRIKILSVVWKSRKRVSVKTSKNKAGKEFTKKVDETYKPRKKDVLKHIDGEMPRHVIMCGPDVCLSWGLMEKRYTFLDAQWKCTLPVVSIIRDNTTGTATIKSFAAKLYQLQEMASEILFEIRLAMKSMGDSRVLIYDTAQTPKSFTKAGFQSGVNRVMTHIKKDKIMYINSAEKGTSKKTFNQFTSLDLSQKGVIQDMFASLAIIEDLAGKFIGLTKEREGQIQQYQTSNATNKSIRGSAARTEVVNTPFDDFVQALFEKMIMHAKNNYEEGEIIQYVIGEFKTKFLKIYKEFFESDFGIYFSDARKDQEAQERIDSAAEMALSNANTPELILGLIDVFDKDTAVEKKAIFQRMVDEMNKRAEQAEAQAAEVQKAQSQAEVEKEAILAKRATDSNTKDIEVAKIYVSGKSFSDNTKATSQERIAAAKIELEAAKQDSKNEVDREKNEASNKEKEKV
jgi:hypothetical protein